MDSSELYAVFLLIETDMLCLISHEIKSASFRGPVSMSYVVGHLFFLSVLQQSVYFSVFCVGGQENPDDFSFRIGGVAFFDKLVPEPFDFADKSLIAAFGYVHLMKFKLLTVVHGEIL